MRVEESLELKDYLVSNRSNLFYALYLRSICIHLRQNKRARDHLSSVSKRARLKYHSILLAIVRRRFVSISKRPIYSTLLELNHPPTPRHSISFNLLFDCFINYVWYIAKKKIKKISKKCYNILQRMNKYSI